MSKEVKKVKVVMFFDRNEPVTGCLLEFLILLTKLHLCFCDIDDSVYQKLELVFCLLSVLYIILLESVVKLAVYI